MPDLRDLMNEAVADITTTGQPAPELDLARARKAARTRRNRLAFVPAGLAAAAAGVLAFSMLGGSSGEPAAPQATATSTAAIALVSYTGDQPVGFTIDRVPDGWEVQGLTVTSLVVAPVGAKNQDANEFEGKILISKANELEVSSDRSEARPLKVGDVEATRFTYDSEWSEEGGSRPGPDASAGLLVPDGDGFLLFQIPSELKWDDATMVAFAEGVHLTGDAVPAQG
ncbi:hypothetical protein [Kineosporia babensis]|uniref:Uncharacterized protein n=1 Tax=Kineosporia babensis TaxID=499548 RepID=A0A9X1NFJ4_9ACTN|nr:hypothetical protein [Kineosporia babensis]MCD5312381.1 hypothetical protein [Kineosporia babensis]